MSYLRSAGRGPILAALICVGATDAGPPPAVYRDLNHNGRLDPYEDRSLSPEQRVTDLLDRMTLSEKVGTMLHANLPGADPLGHSGTGYDMVTVEQMIARDGITSFITRLAVPPRIMAEQNNAVQRLAAKSRLGIPVTISTDPRSHFHTVLGASTSGAGFSTWPETLGFAALRDPARVKAFADIARREYRAVGIHMALSPQVDLATEPRWPRGTATFGSDAALTSALGGAYVEGFQGGAAGLTAGGVATVVKHWVGYGAQPQGFDGHNHYGRFARTDNAAFARHVAAFDGAFAAHAAGVMPTYVIVQGVTLDGKPLEQVGAGFNKQLLTDLLRKKKGFEGMVLSDWAITNDCPVRCASPSAAAPQTVADIGMPWGVELLSVRARFAKGVNAGIDQFGGVADPAPLLAAIRAGEIREARVDEAVGRILRLKFQLGLFDDPYIDVAAAASFVGSPALQAEADRAQREAQVLLENEGLLPVNPAGRKVWLHGLDRATAERAGFVVVDRPAQADVAFVRIAAPFERLHPNHFFGSRHNEGRLDLRDGSDAMVALRKAAAHVPVALVVDLDRPAILTNARPLAKALVATFGASDAAVLDVLTGKALPQGRLPFELPSSMAAVAAQKPAEPDDSAAPLYRFGAGLDLTRH